MYVHVCGWVCISIYVRINTCAHTNTHTLSSNQSALFLFCVVNLPNPLWPPVLQEAAERLTLFTAEEEIFAFQRTVSRITEMQTERYWRDGDRSGSKKPNMSA